MHHFGTKVNRHGCIMVQLESKESCIMSEKSIKNLYEKIEQGLTISHLEIIDESHLHAGHAGARPDGNSHFKAIVVSPDFQSMRRIQRHQTIYRLLQEEMNTHIHALAIVALTPEEYQNETV